MLYDEYVAIVLCLRQKKQSSIASLSDYLNAPYKPVLALVRRLIDLGCPLRLFADGRLSLLREPDVYLKSEILSGFEPKDLGEALDISFFLTLDSTNTYLKSLSRKDGVLLACVAEAQTQGRGRRGKSWVSPFGVNLYLSVRKRIYVSANKSGCISLVAGLAVIKAIGKLGFSGLQIKWPNDIYSQNKKLAGVLIEVVSAKSGFIELVIGVGINVDMPANAAQNIDQPWIDLSQLSANRPPSRNTIVVSLLNELSTSLGLFEREGMGAFQKDWKKCDLLLGKDIVIKREHAVLQGKAVGLNQAGELLVASDNGISAINAGEVSVRLF